MSFSFRILLLFSVITLAIGATSVFVAGHFAEEGLHNELADRGEFINSTLVDVYTNSIANQNFLPVVEGIRKLAGENDDISYIYFTGFEGQVVAHSFPEGFPLELLDVWEGVQEGEAWMLISNSQNNEVFVERRQSLIEGLPAEVHLGLSHETIDLQVSEIREKILLITIIITLVGVLIGAIFVYRFTSPLTHLSSLIYRFGKGEVLSSKDLAFQTSTKELNNLVDTFKAMLGERAINEAELRLASSVFENSQDAIFVTDSDSTILAMNPAFSKITGYSATEAVGNTPEFIRSGNHNHSFFKNIWQTVRDNGRWQGEVWLKHRNGKSFPSWHTISSMTGENGEVENYIFIFSDISDRKKAEDELKRSEERFELAMRGANDGLWDWDLKTNLVYYSPRWCEMLGYSIDELETNLDTWARLVNPDDKDFVLLEVQKYLDGDTDTFSPEFRMRHKNGEWVNILSRAFLVIENGEPVRLVGTHVDITERKRNELALKESNKTLEQQVAERTRSLLRASEAKSAFLAKMSHEIRTPLNGTLGMANIGLRETKEVESKVRFRQILDSGQHLLGIINDILDVSKIEAGKLVIESEPFQLINLVEEAISMLAERAADKYLKLSVDFGPNLPGWVTGDSMRVRQILLNLLSNALKFTSEGGVAISVTYESGVVHFKVSDTGIGIGEEQITRLFSPFEQADSSITREYGGTGLGLSISCNLAKLMAGDIHVESKEGEGSCFILKLPLSVAEVTGETRFDQLKIEPNRLAGLRILVVDDIEINRIILEDLLEYEAAEVMFAEDGQLAVDRVREVGVDKVDIVLMDIQMPVMDGYEATRRILKLAPDLPIIGVTAHALKEEREKCLTAGMVDHTTKPIDIDELIKTIKKACSADILKETGVSG